MTNDKTRKLLFEEFPGVSTGEWEQQIVKDLKGADYQKRLVWNTLDGIAVRPYYRQEDIDHLPETGIPGSFPFLRGTKKDSNSWLIRQDIAFTNASQTAERVKYLLSKGVQAIGLDFAETPEVLSLVQLFEAVSLEQMELNFIHVDPKPVCEAIRIYSEKAQKPKSFFRGSLGYDPLGDFTRSGILGDEELIFDELAGLIAEMRDYSGLRIIEVHASYFHNAGATSTQELGYAISQATEYLDQLTDRDLGVQEIVAKMSFSYAVGANYFFELAKFRAARALWSKVLQYFDPQEAQNCKTWIHAETSTWNTTVYDPHVNLLRTTTEAMSSILGGIDSLTIHPYNSCYTEPDEIAQRLARNQQLVLREEAYLDKVVDPAAGSYYVEHLTQSLIQSSWDLFIEMESQGGYVDAFLEGLVQDAITGIAQQRDLNLAIRQEVLLGTNQYPNASEKQFHRTDMKRSHPPVADLTDAVAQALNCYRGAEDFEKLRFEVEQASKKPVVFLLSIGNPVMRKARAGFAANFFACAGYEVIDPIGFESLEAGFSSAREAGADLVVLCSSDEEYGIFGPEAAKWAKGSELVIAGYPREILEDLQKAGIRHFIHMKTNVLNSLRAFNQLLGISK